MPETRYISQGNVEILLIDLSHMIDYVEVESIVSQAVKLAQINSGAGALLTLLDLTGIKINKEVRSSLKSLSKNNGRYAKVTAFVGLKSFWKLLFTSIFRIRGKKNHKVFISRTEAVKWLQTW
ncbi:MAG TPA: hypothetical protein VMT35_13155 [Ignavibacteriaceae bacterium]|nr:hypothetical protein [Ignavibacteriaceae bacterium]